MSERNPKAIEQSVPPLLLAYLIEAGMGGYESICMRAGKVCAIQRFAFTWGLLVGMGFEVVYECRYCFEHKADALEALRHWDGQGDPGGPWIKRKGGGKDVAGPGATHAI